jgi:hypothetical protein
MKKEEVKSLIREHMALRKRIESLQQELSGVEERYEQIGDLIYGYRSRSFIQSVLHCVIDLKKECGEDIHYDDILESIINILQNYEEFYADRRHCTPKELLHLYGEEVD